MFQALTTRIGAGVLILMIACGFAYWSGGKSAQEALDQEKRDHRVTKGFYAKVLRDHADRAAEVARLAKAASVAAAREREQNDARFQEERDGSDREIADLRRRLRAGELSLQPWWTCPSAGPGAGDAATPAGGQDGDAALRIESALEGIADADHADRWIEWLQFELVSTREAVKAAGCAVEATP